MPFQAGRLPHLEPFHFFARTNEELQLQLSATQRECLTQQRILDAAKLSMLLFDDKGQITMYNREALMLANQQLKGKNIMDVSTYAELLEEIFRRLRQKMHRRL